MPPPAAWGQTPSMDTPLSPPFAPASPPARGFTLLELACALLLLSVLLGTALPRLRGVVDRSAVVAAREALAGALARARMDALTHGGARLRLQRRPSAVSVEVPGREPVLLPLEDRFGVELVLSRGRREVELRFDALGLGRMTSETVRIRRNGSEVRLVVSGYGRVRRP